MVRAAVILIVLGVVVAGGTWSWRENARMERMNDIAAAQRLLATTRLAPAGSAPQAGISARSLVEVRSFPEKLARQLHGDPDFHRLSHRCGVCHGTPDPKLHTPDEWPAVIARMSATIDAAGLLPLSAADSAAIMRVLTR